MQSTFAPDDVTLLLTDITGKVEPMEIEERDRLIQQGVNYSETLPLEYEPTPEYLDTFWNLLNTSATQTADAVKRVAESIYAQKGSDITLVSLARAGIPVGILLKRYFKHRYNLDVPHYAISIIRGKGIDKNAMHFILRQHTHTSIQFVDGWTGKGAIYSQLVEALAGFPSLAPSLAVLSDPAGVAEHAGTVEDTPIASACLNATVTGLISRTVHREDVIAEDEFHGAVYYGHLKKQDLTYLFIGAVESHFSDPPAYSYHEVDSIRKTFQISSIHHVKPGIGETTRVLLRRVPWVVLVHSMEDHKNLRHIYQLAKERGVPLLVYPLKHYKAVGLVKKVLDE